MTNRKISILTVTVLLIVLFLVAALIGITQLPDKRVEQQAAASVIVPTQTESNRLSPPN